MNNLSWELEISQLDVGCGDSSLVLFLQNSQVKKSILIDGGYGYNSEAIEDVLSQKLNSRKCLDAIIITHWDCDHWKGISALVGKGQWINKDTVFLCQSPNLSKAKGIKKFVLKLQSKNFRCMWSHKVVLTKSIWNFFPEKTAPMGSPDLKFIAMNRYVIERKDNLDKISESKVKLMSGPTETNQASISCLIRFKDFAHLTSGDICENLEISIVEYLKASGTRLTGMKISHHGSQHSSPLELFRDLRCRYSIISHGGDKDHPHHKVLKKIYDSSIQLCYLTNDYLPLEFLKSLIPNSSEFIAENLIILKRISECLESLNDNYNKIEKCVEGFVDNDEYGYNSDPTEDEILKHIKQNLSQCVSVSDLKRRQETLNDGISGIDDAMIRIEQEIPKYLRGNRDLFKFLSKEKKKFLSIYDSLGDVFDDFDDWLRQARKYVNSPDALTDQIELPSSWYQGSSNGKSSKDHQSFLRYYEGRIEEILKPLADLLEGILSEKKIEKISFDFQDLMQNFESYLQCWNENSVRKILVAGTEYTKTRAGVPREMKGDILVKVLSAGENETQTQILFNLNKQKQKRRFADCYLSRIEIESDELLRIIHQKVGNKNKNSACQRFLKQTIQSYETFFKERGIEEIPSDEEFTAIFKKNIIEEKYEIFSLKLKSKLRMLKLKYMISNFPLNELGKEKWAVRRYVNSFA